MARLRLRFTEDAQYSFQRLLARSERQWGPDRANRYEEEIFETLDRLRDQPGIGVSRPDILKGCRAIPVERHTVFYIVEGGDLVVVQILHQRQDAASHFPKPT